MRVSGHGCSDGWIGQPGSSMVKNPQHSILTAVEAAYDIRPGPQSVSDQALGALRAVRGRSVRLFGGRTQAMLYVNTSA